MITLSLIPLFIYIAVTDLKNRIIPNVFLVFLILIKTVSFIEYNNITDSVSGLLLMSVFAFIAKRFYDRFGAGDYKYLAVIGYCIGLQNIHIFCFASVITVISHLLINRNKSNVAAAPYLSVGAVIALLWRLYV